MPDPHWQPIDLPEEAESVVTPEEREAYSNLFNQVYGYMGRVGLTEKHRENLSGRGLSEEEIRRRGYFSVERVCPAPTPKPDEFLLDLSPFREFQMPGVPKEELLHLPGFRLKNWRKKKKKEEEAPKGLYFGPNGGQGIFIPCRDTKGRIIGGQVRLFDDPENKYKWLPGGGSFAHVPLGFQPSEEIWITEGLLKADICTCQGYPCIGVGGATCGGKALPLLREWGPKRVVIAYDSDQWTECDPSETVRGSARALKAEGFEPMAAVWAFSKAKGLDDLLREGKQPNLIGFVDLDSDIRRVIPQSPKGMGECLSGFCQMLRGTIWERYAFGNPPMKVLGALSEAQSESMDGLSFKELMDRTGLPKTTLGRAIKELRANGDTSFDGEVYSLPQLRSPEPQFI